MSTIHFAAQNNGCHFNGETYHGQGSVRNQDDGLIYVICEGGRGQGCKLTIAEAKAFNALLSLAIERANEIENKLDTQTDKC